MMELISMKFRTGKRNTDQQGPGSDVRKIENIMKLIDMKFKKRNIRNSDENNSKQRDENEEKLTELRDNMERRSFSSLRIRHDDEQTLQESYRMMSIIKHLVSQGQEGM